MLVQSQRRDRGRRDVVATAAGSEAAHYRKAPDICRWEDCAGKEKPRLPSCYSRQAVADEVVA